MTDREKVIKGLDCCIKQGEQGILDCDSDCPYGEHGNRLDCWIKMNRDALALLEEKDAVKPVLDEQTGRIWLCGKCGSYVGFEDNDPHDPNEFDKYCRECGRPVLWEGR